MALKHLPDAEFEIMKAIWQMEEPVTSPVLTDRLRHTLPERDWKPQTVLTMLVRLEKKGFLRSEKSGKERRYFSLVSEQDYWQVEADHFRARFRDGSFSGLVKALYDGGRVSEQDLEELRQWLDKH